MLTWWFVETRGPSGEHRACVLPLGVSDDGKRNPCFEHLGTGVCTRPWNVNGTTHEAPRALLYEKIESMLERGLRRREIVPEGGSYAAKLIGWVEVAPARPSNGH